MLSTRVQVSLELLRSTALLWGAPEVTIKKCSRCGRETDIAGWEACKEAVGARRRYASLAIFDIASNVSRERLTHSVDGGCLLVPGT